MSSLLLQESKRLLLAQGTRTDDRKAEESRPAVLNVSSLRHADGSALARFGATSVVAGVKAELAKPKAGAGNKGFLVVNVEMGPLCSPHQQSGPPSDQAQTITLFVEKALRKTQCVRLHDLCIVPDHLVWVLYVDIVCLNADGGVIGAAVCAAGAALHDTRLPLVKLDVETGVKTINTSISHPLPVHATPAAVTFAFFDCATLTDPTLDEETLSSGLLTVVACIENDSSVPLFMPGCQPTSSEQLVECFHISQRRAKDLASLLHVAKDSPER